MSRIAAVFASLLLVAVPGPARAAFHITHIDEVMSGVGGDPSIQYVEIRAEGFAGQNQVAHTRLTAFNCNGTSSTILLELPTSVPNGAANMHFVMATSGFAAAACITPDFVIPAGILTPCGQICWGAPGSLFPPNPPTWDATNPDNYVDCVAYGGYTGTRRTFDSASSALPPGNGTMSLTRTGVSGVSNSDFSLQPPAPTNNAGQVGTFGPCPTTTTTTTAPSTTTTTTVPFGDDDPGCVPDTKNHLKCGNALAKALGKAAAAVIKCHKTQAHERLKMVSDTVAGAVEDTCSTSGGGKSAKEKLDAAVMKVQPLCSPSQNSLFMTPEQDLFADKTNTNSLDYLNGSIYCDGTADIDPSGDDAGKVPTDKNRLACADTVGAELAKLLKRAIKCHAKLAATRFAQKPFDEEACEEVDPVKGKAAHQKYSAAMDKLDMKAICAQACLSRTNRDNLGTQMLGVAEALTAVTYPCP